MSLLALVLVAALAPAVAWGQSEPPDSVGASPADSVVSTPPAPQPAPPLPSATLRVETQPSGLVIELNGNPVGRSPTGPIAVPPGTHHVRALPEDPRRFGTPAVDRAITLAAGSEFTMRFDLRPPVVLRTDPEPALVTLTGRQAPDSLLGSTPLTVRPSAIEPYGLRFAREAFADTTVPGVAFLAKGEPVRVALRRVAAAPVSESNGRVPLYRKRWVQWSLVGIGAVLTGAAAVWHREADRTYDEYLASSNVEEIPGLYDRAVDLDHRATASFLVGQAVLITGGVLLLMGQSH